MSLHNGRAFVARHVTSFTCLLGAVVLFAACSETPATAIDADASFDVAAASRKGPGGNSLNAKSCQKNGWQELVTSTGTAFPSEEACVAYAAQGGMLQRGQTITFGPLADQTFGDADFTVSASASSGLPVSFAASGQCTVTGSTVSLTGAGSCTITASQPGDATTAAAISVDQAFAIAKGNQSITFTSPNPSPAAVGTTYSPTASATSVLTVAITLDAASTGCSLAGGVVSFTGDGTCVVNANAAGDDNYTAAAQVQQAISVIAPCINDDASLRAAAATGGSHTFCAAGTRVLLTGGQLTVGTTLVLTAVGEGNAIIDARNQSRVIQVIPGGHLTLNNVTVTTGWADNGGGVYVDRGALILNGSSAVRENTATRGAGIFVASGSGSVTMNDAASVANNLAQDFGGVTPVEGGGIQLLTGATLTMNHSSTIARNDMSGYSSASSTTGAGVSSLGASVTMNHMSSITENGSSAVGGGGGLAFYAFSTLTMSETARITGNVARNGGGIYTFSGAFFGITSTNVTGNSPNNCFSGLDTPAVPGCVNP